MFAIGLLACRASQAKGADDVEVLAGNIYRQTVTNVVPDTTIAAHLAALRPDGSFAGVDYADKTRASWRAHRHLNNVNEMLVAWAAPTSAYYHSGAVRDGAVGAYQYWVRNDYQNPNWYFNQIATPQKLASAMIVMQQGGFLPGHDFAKAIAIVGRAIKGQGGASQGANLVSQAKITVVEGVVRYRVAGADEEERAAAEKLIRKSYAYIGSTLGTVAKLEDDGIRVDHSFQQHEQTLYDGGYGASLLSNVAASASWAVGTRYGLSPADLRGMVDYLLDGGPQWMVRGPTYDPLASGRYWSRAGTPDNASALLGPVDAAIALSGGYRGEELASLRARLAYAAAHHEASPELEPTGNRAYWISDYMVHRRPGFMMSVKAVSSRTNTPESINGENLKGGYGTAGVNLLFRTGREFDDIYPVWDWYRLPGTTSERPPAGADAGYDLTPDHHLGRSAIAGGASDGTVGATLYQMDEYGIGARKSYFFFPRGEVAMGTSIREPAPNMTGGVVGTNVNQTLLRGEVAYSTEATGRATMAAGLAVIASGVRWVNHDSVGYLFPTPADNVAIGTADRHGDWRSINVTGSTRRVTKPVFSLDLQHGQRPASASYLYAVIPGISPDEMDAYLATNPFAVAPSDPTVHAVTDNASRVTAVNFFAEGSVTLPTGTTLRQATVGRASSLLWAPSGDHLTLSFADVDGRPDCEFTYVANLKLLGPGATWDDASRTTTLQFRSPSGPMWGTTRSLTFEVARPAEGNP